MGNNANKAVDNDTINWNNIKTENMSSTLGKYNGLSADANKLLVSLNLPKITETEASDFNIENYISSKGLTKNDQAKVRQIVQQLSATDDLSATSPFMSAEMYDHLVNSKTSETANVAQTGGAKKKKAKSKSKRRSMSEELDDSDTSSTSDLSDSDSDSLSSLDDSDSLEKKKHHKKKEHHKSNEQKKPMKVEHSRNDVSDDDKSDKSDKSTENAGNLSYLSSSAHSESAASQASLSNDNRSISSVSVNTEDINMIRDSDS